MATITKAALDNLSLDKGVDTFMLYTAQNSTLLPYWWSEQREQALRIASIENDMISSVIQTVMMKLFTLPIAVVPKNMYTNGSIALAKTYTQIVNNSWNKYAELFLNDLMTFDKGAFLLIEGAENVSRPLDLGEIPTGFRHIPSQSIHLRSDPEYPYLLIQTNGPNIKIHSSRIIRLTQMPTSIGDNTYTGLSFVSRAFNIGQLMMSSIQYGLEGLGKLDSDTIIWGTAVTSKSIQQAFKDAKIDSNNSGLRSNGSKVYLGLRDPSAKLDVLDLKRLPANFNYETFLRVTVKLLAIAAGIDEDDIAATSSAGTTKTATLISDLKSRFKLVAWFTTKITKELEQKLLPDNLIIQIGDTSGEINESEAKTRINIARTDELLNRTGALTVRAARQNAVMHGFINQSQFEAMELDEGRLANGMPVYTLFFTDNEMLKSMLNIGVTDPCNIKEDKVERVLERAKAKLCEVESITLNTTSDNIFHAARSARAALLWVIDEYEPEEIMPLPTSQAIEPTDTQQLDDVTEDTQIEDAPEDATVKKEYTRPSSKRGRRNQTNVRKIVRNVWSSDTDVVKATIQDLLDATDDEEIRNILVANESELETFLHYLETNTQTYGTKLSDVYSKLDSLIDW